MWPIMGLTLRNIPLKQPSGKGKQIVIGAAITEDGWLELMKIQYKTLKNLQMIVRMRMMALIRLKLYRVF